MPAIILVLIIIIIVAFILVLTLKRRSANLESRDHRNEAGTGTTFATDITKEKELSEKEQGSDNKRLSEKAPSDAELVDGDSDSGESDHHEYAEQTDATISEAVADFTYNIALGTMSAVGSGVNYLTSMVYGNPTEDHETSDCES